MEMDQEIEMEKNLPTHKKLYGYVACGAIMFATAFSDANTHTTESDSVNPVATHMNTTLDSPSDIPNHNKRIYFIEGKPVVLDTSKQGWAVEILLKGAPKDQPSYISFSE